jgi:hypothetical protein
MPAEQSKSGMGRRRQGDTGPDRSDDSNPALERALEESQPADTDYERGKQAGASGVDQPHKPVKPGTQRDIEESGV